MKNIQFIDDKRNSSKLINFPCLCGLVTPIDLRHGPMATSLVCPNLYCQSIFVLEYVGRNPAPMTDPVPAQEPESVPPAPLRLVK